MERTLTERLAGIRSRAWRNRCCFGCRRSIRGTWRFTAEKAWKGNMLTAALTHCVLRVTFDEKGKPTGQEKMPTEMNQRIRELRIGPDGYIYWLRCASDGTGAVAGC